METLEIEKTIATIVSVVLDLHESSKLQGSFTDTLKYVLDLGQTWKLTENTEIPASVKLMLELIAGNNEQGLAEYLKMVVEAENASNKENTNPIGQYELKMTKVLQIVQEKIDTGCFRDIGDDQAIYDQIVAYLESTETKWRENSQAGESTEYNLPPPHRTILYFYENDDARSLVRYIRKSILSSEEAGQNEVSTSKKATMMGHVRYGILEKLIGAIGTVLIVGLATIHILTPDSTSFKIRGEQDDPGFIIGHPQLSRWSTIGLVFGVITGTILIWNIYHVCKKYRTISRATKCILDSCTPMILASGVGYKAALSLASFAPPIWLSALLFSSLALMVYCIIGAIVTLLTGILFFKNI